MPAWAKTTFTRVSTQSRDSATATCITPDRPTWPLRLQLQPATCNLQHASLHHIIHHFARSARVHYTVAQLVLTCETAAHLATAYLPVLVPTPIPVVVHHPEKGSALLLVRGSCNETTNLRLAQAALVPVC